ncbi:hypothetical protein V3Q90_00470 [Flavobacterium oreochromis]
MELNEEFELTKGQFESLLNEVESAKDKIVFQNVNIMKKHLFLIKD